MSKTIIRYHIKFQSYIFILLLALMPMVGCQQDSSEVNHINDTTNVAISDQLLNSIDYIAQATAGGTFETYTVTVDIPEDFILKPSIPSVSEEEGYDSYFFVSPDDEVKFYLYAPQNMGTPNDIILPNEKIPVQTVSKDDITEKSWKLNQTKQVPYFREFTETITNGRKVITGLYYINNSAKEHYANLYIAFKNSIQYKLNSKSQ